jgi:2-oxoglutarate ferredoxin oxidoreductase subunit gamma
MKKEVLFAGFGGQGLLFAGKILAYAALFDGKELSWLPSYGPEMRGGTANCSVCLSDEPVACPLVSEPDYLVAMNKPSFAKFLGATRKGGLVLVDSTMVDDETTREDVKMIRLPATEVTGQNGCEGMANMMLLGRLLAETKLVTREAVEYALYQVIPPKRAHLIEANLRALQLGVASAAAV